MYNIFQTDNGLIAVPTFVNILAILKTYPEAVKVKEKVEKEELEKGVKIERDFSY